MITFFNKQHHRLSIIFTCLAFLLYQLFLFCFNAVNFFNYTPWILFSIFLALQFNKSGLFLKDFSLFALLVLFFNFMRGGIYAIHKAFDLPLYKQYVISFEKLFIASGSLSNFLQQHLWHPENIGLFDNFNVFIYSSHFAFFIIVALVIWLKKPGECWRYRNSLITCCFIGLALYSLLPTMPPWMASDQQIIPHVDNIFHIILQAKFGDLITLLDTNPIAAMPSLHVTFPFLSFLALTHHFNIKRSWPVLIYFSLVVFATIYLGAHYLADILAGMIIAFFCYYYFYKKAPSRPYISSVTSADLLLIIVQAILYLLLTNMIKFSVLTIIGII